MLPVQINPRNGSCKAAVPDLASARLSRQMEDGKQDVSLLASTSLLICHGVQGNQRQEEGEGGRQPGQGQALP